VTTARRNRPYAPRLSHEQRREQLLDATLDIINTDGIGAVSMDAVARRAGVTRPVVYNQFTDTQDMLCASLDREEQRALAQLVDAVPEPDNDDTPTAFHRFFDTFLSAVTEAPQRWRAIFMIADSGTPTSRQRVDRARTWFVERFDTALRGVRSVDRPVDPELLAHHLLATLWESGRLLLLSPEDFTHDRLLRSLDTLLVAVVGEQRTGEQRVAEHGKDT
jgi:AcrR family transcriptional regulator